jgi:hypothetical protein
LACGERGATRFCHEIDARLGNRRKTWKSTQDFGNQRKTLKIDVKLDEFPATVAKIIEMKSILLPIAACLVLAACQSTPPPQLSRAAASLTQSPVPQSPLGITGRLLDNGRPVKGTPVRITSANRPSHTIATTTDSAGRFYLSADDTGPASPAGDILRIEVIGQDYHAAGEVSPASLQVTCDLAGGAAYALGHDNRFWSGNDTQASLSPAPKGLKCW